MVGIVIVSHSAALAGGVVELAREMAGEARVEAAGGLAEPKGAIGTDAALVAAAIERADAGDGVLVLMDLGSAVMSAELAVEMGAGADGDVLLCEAPLVEGAIAAAARAAGAGTLEEVAAEARAALAMKAAQLGVAAADDAEGRAGEPHSEAQRRADVDPRAEGRPPTTAGSGDAPAGPEAQLRITVRNRLGLHARPAARLVATIAGFDARVEASDESTGRGPVDARSLTALIALGVRVGHVLVLRVTGAESAAAIAAARELAAQHFGDPPESVVSDPVMEAVAAGGPVTAAGGDATAAGGRPGEAARAGPREDTGSAGRIGIEPAGMPPAEAPAPGDVLRGAPASSGIGIGAARLLGARRRAARTAAPAGVADPEGELERLEQALSVAREQLRELRTVTAARVGDEEAAIFDAQMLMLEDAGLLEPARAAIATRGARAEDAWADAAAAASVGLEALEDVYLRERAADVRDVAERVVALLSEEVTAPAGVEGVLVADDVTPAQVAGLDPERVQGLALARGGATTHAAILARALAIPAAVALGDEVLAIPDGTPVIVDGDAGTLEVAPPPERVAQRERERAAAAERAQRALAHAGEPAVTRDGTRVAVLANLGDAAELEQALEFGAEGVGLLRTEFLFLDRRSTPDEDEQREVYTRIARALAGRPLVIRTLDAGADKPLPILRQEREANPYLGVRGIRLGLEHPAVLETQLRAIAAVAAEHPLSVMVPMVTTLAELRAARGLLEAARAAAGAPPIALGIMVEVPAVALMAERFAAEADFFSIGTNDLAQYTMAAERGHARLTHLLDGPPPALLELIARVVDAAARAGRHVAVCGELAGQPEGAALLTGLGVRELSMAATRIPEVKQIIRSLDATAAGRTAQEARGAGSGERVAELSRGLLAAPAGATG